MPVTFGRKDRPKGDIMVQPLARITPQKVAVPIAKVVNQLTSREKAAIVVRLLLSEGASLPLASLPEHMQAALTEQMAQMRMVDRETMQMVAEEFLTEVESVGLSFPGGIEGALSILDGHISPNAASRLRRLAGASGKIDPWERIVLLTPDRLIAVLEEEASEIGAVLLSKLPVPRAAELLGKLPGDRARRIAHAVSMTTDIDPDTVRRVGLALLTQIESQPPRAFETVPDERVGAILNAATSGVRDRLLDDLSQEDQSFAEKVRKRIFTFGHIPVRVAPRDVPTLLRAVEQPVLITALQGAKGDLAEVADFIFANISKRMAEALTEQIAEALPSSTREIEAAQASVIEALRQMAEAGEIRFLSEHEEEEAL